MEQNLTERYLTLSEIFYHYDLYGSYLAAAVTTGVMIVVSSVLLFLSGDNIRRKNGNKTS